MNLPRSWIPLALTAALAAFVAGCSAGTGAGDADGGAGAGVAAKEVGSVSAGQAGDPESAAPGRTEVATFGAGCFWCVEAVLEQIDGVTEVKSGYMGGHVDDPTYKQICSGETGHAEVVQVTFEPARVTYDTLLDWFWRLHDPTTPNRQGGDVGTQYRSAIFVHSAAQREAAESSRSDADGSGAFPAPIVTEITEAGTFYEAEGYHQDYYRENKEQPYCRVVIRPKLGKLGLKE